MVTTSVGSRLVEEGAPACLRPLNATTGAGREACWAAVFCPAVRLPPPDEAVLGPDQYAMLALAIVCAGDTPRFPTPSVDGKSAAKAAVETPVPGRTDASSGTARGPRPRRGGEPISLKITNSHYMITKSCQVPPCDGFRRPAAEQDVITQERPRWGERSTKETAVSESRPGISLTGAAALVAAMVVVALPAQAGTCPASTTCPTTVTFTVTAPGGLTITVPDGPVNLGSGAPGTQIGGQLGPVTVSDQRAALTATWTATVIAATGGFTTGGGTTPETIPTDDALYWSGPATATTGTGTFVPGQANAAAAQTLNVSRTASSKTTGSGNNSATWNPTLLINVPDQAVAGVYTGTVNHSVA
ncbi:hypothetical protein Sros_3275 [Streptosporangium roseum DSM 43021]|uniref:WxL domain-containing protein n=1 Tax=Streptosporangium roseum (strain ATCC 12428 / DSM 43021 / JCM 3005 / KCTC 9067 / NCIMB 10171 / NRRL 2505 / NI 9100) TaxID=479432 RepID=D2BDC5_STRRD|nr:hypothetical protein Sros_3275 [Streptosporangium roseum DSM 43021]